MLTTINGYRRDIETAQTMIQRIKDHYGHEPCEVRDIEDFADDPGFNADVNDVSRCALCAAHDVIKWLEETFLDFVRSELTDRGLDPDVKPRTEVYLVQAVCDEYDDYPCSVCSIHRTKAGAQRWIDSELAELAADEPDHGRKFEIVSTVAYDLLD
jgi:hypothetical protein